MDFPFWYFAVFSDLTRTVNSLKARVAKYGEGPGNFQDLVVKLDSVAEHTCLVGGILTTYADSVQPATLALFRRRLESVQQRLQGSEQMLSELCRNIFEQHSSGKLTNVLSKFRNLARTEATSGKLSRMRLEVNESLSNLQSIVVDLSMCVQTTSLNITGSAVTSDEPRVSSPSLPMTVSDLVPLNDAGVSLAVFPHLSRIVNSLQVRMTNYKRSPAVFQDLDAKLDGVMERASLVGSILTAHVDSVRPETLALFRERLESVQKGLQGSEQIMSELCREVFEQPDAGKLTNVLSKFRALARTEATSGKLSRVDIQVKESSSILQSIVAELSLCVQTTSLGTKSSTAPVYRPGKTTPSLPFSVSLDFNTRETPEGKLKRIVLSIISSSTPAVVGAMPSLTYAIVGMPGVGKSIALQGLAFEADIQDHFCDGIQFMSLGQGATLQTVMEEIGRIMTSTGGNDIVRIAANSPSPSDIFDYAVTWFKRRTCLFLVDDLWPTNDCKTGYLDDLRQLLRESPQSRMVVSTRSVDIADRAELKVDFKPRDPLGPVSERIFMTYATGHTTPEAAPEVGREFRSSVSTILKLCGGLPIALSVTGCAVALLVREHENFESACDAYAIDLEAMRTSLGDEQSPDGTSLSSGILVSLQYLEVEFLKWKSSNAPNVEYTISDLYASLGLLGNQGWIPVSGLSAMWKIDEGAALEVVMLFSRFNLATLQVRQHKHGSTKEAGLVLHNLLFDFCRRRAEENNVRPEWEEAVLSPLQTALSSCLAGRTSPVNHCNSLITRDSCKVSFPEWCSAHEILMLAIRNGDIVASIDYEENVAHWFKNLYHTAKDLELGEEDCAVVESYLREAQRMGLIDGIDAVLGDMIVTQDIKEEVRALHGAGIRVLDRVMCIDRRVMSIDARLDMLKKSYERYRKFQRYSQLIGVALLVIPIAGGAAAGLFSAGANFVEGVEGLTVKSVVDYLLGLGKNLVERKMSSLGDQVFDGAAALLKPESVGKMEQENRQILEAAVSACGLKVEEMHRLFVKHSSGASTVGVEVNSTHDYEQQTRIVSEDANKGSESTENVLASLDVAEVRPDEQEVKGIANKKPSELEAFELSGEGIKKMEESDIAALWAAFVVRYKDIKKEKFRNYQDRICTVMLKAEYDGNVLTDRQVRSSAALAKTIVDGLRDDGKGDVPDGMAAKIEQFLNSLV